MKSSISCASSSTNSGLVANQTGHSNSNVFIALNRIIRLQTNYIRDVLISGGLLFLRPFPTLQIPNFKTSPATDEGDLAFQSNLSAKLVRHNETSLSIRSCVLSAGVQLAQENPAISRGNSLVRFCRRAHSGKLVRGHDEQKLLTRLGQKDEVFSFASPPARRNGDSILLVY